MPPHLSAILWAQWRTLRNFYPRNARGGLILTLIVSAIWYGGWTVAAAVAATLYSDPEAGTLLRALPGVLLLAFLYWQVIPILMMATGASLELKKLVVYPITPGELFTAEVALRLTTSIEMLLVTCGIAIGLALNPAVAWWGPLVMPVFIVFNLMVSAGLRDLIARLLARRRIREIVFLALVLIAALPQLVLIGLQNPENRDRIRFVLEGAPIQFLPWNATATLAQGNFSALALLSLPAWVALAYWFAWSQFRRTLRFDSQAAAASRATPRTSDRWNEHLFRLPSRFFPDPLAALIEKEFRFLTRAPRFRMVFLMGFTFGLLIWVPMLRTTAGAQSTNSLIFICIYSLLLIGDVCFWNAFGFDRSAAQVYFVMPVKFSTVLVAKNLTAFFFVLAEIAAITAVCALLRLPLTAAKIGEAFAVTTVLSIFLIGLGNVTSIHMARPVNPANSFRNASAGRMQMVLLLLYPLASIPVLLAYGARYAFDSDQAFYIVLAVDLLIAAVVYYVSMDSALKAADERKEIMIETLSKNEGPIAA